MDDPAHLAWLDREARRLLAFFHPSLRADGGYDVLDFMGSPLPRVSQELHTTTRMIHSYALGRKLGHPGSDTIIDAGMDFLWHRHRDGTHGGYLWAVRDRDVIDGSKLAYGHAFVLLAASSARLAGHPDADRLIADIVEVIDRHYWDEQTSRLREEYTRDWQTFSTYRGMNANMHGVEAMLAAFEATGETIWLDRAGRILDFFIGAMAASHDWRIQEHYTETWQVDPSYSGNPMFRPAGTTPGHSLEFGRLILHHWDLARRPDSGAPDQARALIGRALADAWMPDGGIAYTLDDEGRVAIPDRYWWPVAEAIGAVATLLKIAPAPQYEQWYRRLWTFADAHLIDHTRGGWFPELAPDGRPASRQFLGKPDVYHALQATVIPSFPRISRYLQ